jgi:hypothetical protein
MNLVPNPTNGELSINTRYNFEKIEITTITGQVLLSQLVNEKTYQLQLNHLAGGVYFVRVGYDNGMGVTKKIIKY